MSFLLNTMRPNCLKLQLSQTESQASCKKAHIRAFCAHSNFMIVGIPNEYYAPALDTAGRISAVKSGYRKYNARCRCILTAAVGHSRFNIGYLTSVGSTYTLRFKMLSSMDSLESEIFLSITEIRSRDKNATLEEGCPDCFLSSD